MAVTTQTERTAPRLRAALAPPAALAILVLLPALAVLASLLDWRGGSMSHIWTTTGPIYLLNTVLLCGLVAAGCTIVGVAAASIVTLAEFPLRRALSFLLVAPFAAPAYITAYVYADALGPFGWANSALGALSPDIRTLPGAAFVLTLALYPYVYLAVKASLEGRSGALLEAARACGRGPGRAVLDVLLPAGRAAFAAGLALALMETASDYGVAEHFGVPTLSVGIFRTWHGLGDLASASQIASGLFILALLFASIEAAARRGLGAEPVKSHRRATRIRLGPLHSLLAILACAAPVLLGFAAPAAALASKLAHASIDVESLIRATANTAFVSALAAALAIAAAALLVRSARALKSRLLDALVRVATLGYALPGAVVAIGILFVAGSSTIASAGILLLLYAYLVRFLMAAHGAAAAGAAQIHPLTDDAARSLGASAAKLSFLVHWPLARPALRAGLIVVFIDVARELPATLLLRPFNFDTLATTVFRFASDERLAEAAPAALALIALSLVGAVLISGTDQLFKTARSTAAQM